jgi:hypothetical protein
MLGRPVEDSTLNVDRWHERTPSWLLCSVLAHHAPAVERMSRRTTCGCVVHSHTGPGPPDGTEGQSFLSGQQARFNSVRSDSQLGSLVGRSEQILQRERQGLARRVYELRQRADMHREVLEHLEQQLAREEHLLREIEELADRSPQLRLERLDRQLKGRRLQEVAVEVLRRRVGHDQAIHYREWFALLRADGYEIADRDPMNNFLTSIGRAPGVKRVGSRSGLYSVAA